MNCSKILSLLVHLVSLSFWLVFPSIGRYRYQRTYNYQEVSRTLCPSEATNETGPLKQLIFVDIASMAPLGAQYKLLVTKIKHFQLQ